MVLFSIVITILGLVYIVSPLDFIPDVIPILGWTDDFLVLMIIVGTWAVQLGIILVDVLFNVILLSLIVVGLIALTKYLSKKK